MANPLQPKCIETLEKKYGAYVINITASSRSGHMDAIACINGEFWGFEFKWKTDTPSELQKQKLNKCIDAGGKAYFIKSVQQMCETIDNKHKPVKYTVKNHFTI